MSRRVAFALITLLATALFVKPLIRGEVLTFRDHSDYFQPLRHFTTEELRHFRLPLWNPYNASGEPWLANPQTAVFYPPAWIFVFLPFATAYVLFLFLHVVLLGWGAFLLFSRLASARAALIGSLILMLAGPTLSMVDISNNLATFAWIPLVLWCALAEVSTVASAAAIAMSFLAGEPFFAAVGALLFVGTFLRSFSPPRGEKVPEGRMRGLRLLDTALTAFCLTGIQLLPFAANIAGSDRAGSVPPEEILRDSMSLGDWLRMVIPGGTHQQFIPIVYIGIVPALLALIGIWDRRARWWLALLALSVFTAAGSFLPFIGELLTRLPLTIIRYPARVVPLGMLALAALAVIGWERTERRLRFWWLPMAAVALIIADVVPRIAPLLASAPFDGHPVSWPRTVGRDGKIARLMPASLHSFDRRAWIAGYLNLFDRRFDAWTAAPMVSESYTRAYEAAWARRDLLDRMSIAYIVTKDPRGVAIHRNPTALPMAYWRDDAGHMVQASLLACTTSSVYVAIDAPADGMVIVTQRAAPGWRVEIDGAVATAERDGLFRAVRVRRGHHAIAWSYRPRALMIGMALTIVAIARMLLSLRFVNSSGTKNFFSRREFHLKSAVSAGVESRSPNLPNRRMFHGEQHR